MNDIKEEAVQKEKNLEEEIWRDVTNIDDMIKISNGDSSDTLKLFEERHKLLADLTKVHQIKEENKARSYQIDSESLNKLKEIQSNERIRNQEIQADLKKESIHNKIAIATFSISTIIGIWAVIKTFKFDDQNTITSTLGRSSINNVVSKLFKR